MTTYWKGQAPDAPFYAVIFISQKSKDLDGYAEMDERMMQASQRQPGFLGYTSAGDEHRGVFISYWESKEAIESWRKHSGHRKAKAQAPTWYAYYHSMICKVESSQVHGEWLDTIL